MRALLSLSLGLWLGLSMAVWGQEPTKQDPLAQMEQEILQGQKRVEAKYRRFREVLLRMAQYLADKDPVRAQLLRRAIEESNQRNIEQDLQQILQALQQQRLASAVLQQDEVLQDLTRILELLLSEQRSQRLADQKARLKQYIKEVKRLLRQQRVVEDRTHRGEPTQNLAPRQGQIAQDTKRLADRIARNEGLVPASPQGPNSSNSPADGSQGSSGKNGSSPDSQGQKPPSSGKPHPPNGKPSQSQNGKPQGKPNDKPSDNSQGNAQGQQNPNGSQGQNGQDSSKPGQSNGQNGKPNQGSNPGNQGNQGDSGSQGQSGQQSDQDQSLRNIHRQIQQAQQRMEQARKQLEKARREGALEEERKAAELLEKIQRQLERLLRQLREEEMARVLANLEARLRKMLNMQVEVYEGTLRLNLVPPEQRGRHEQIQAGRLSRRQSLITLEANKALQLLRADGTSVAMVEALLEVREDMQQVAVRLAQLKVGQITQGIQEDIIAALEEMLEAVRKAQDELQQRRNNPRSRPGQPMEPPLIDMLAELKMLRSMEIRVRKRTARYQKLIGEQDPVGQATEAELLEALRRLAQRQRRITKAAQDIVSGRNR